MPLVDKKESTNRRSHDIIAGILRVDDVEFFAALREDAHSVNSEHNASGMNAAMLCAFGRQLDYLRAIIERSGDLIDYTHTTVLGDDLQEVALSSLDPECIRIVEAAYSQYAPHIANNWPTPG